MTSKIARSNITIIFFMMLLVEVSCFCNTYPTFLDDLPSRNDTNCLGKCLRSILLLYVDQFKPILIELLFDCYVMGCHLV